MRRDGADSVQGLESGMCLPDGGREVISDPGSRQIRLQAEVVPNVRASVLGPVHSSRFVFTSWNLDVEHGSANVERYTMVSDC